jgi:ribose 5-phosphate isomerase B
MNIVIGADHRGFEHKEYIKKYVDDVQFFDIGAYDAQRSDYPLFAHAACKKIVAGEADCGILLCGSGVGMAIVANRYKTIRAALVWSVETAARSKEDDNANVLVLPSDYISLEESVAMIAAWRLAEFKGGRYEERILMIDE